MPKAIPARVKAKGNKPKYFAKFQPGIQDPNLKPKIGDNHFRWRIKVQTITVKMGPKLEPPYPNNGKLRSQKMTAHTGKWGPRHTQYEPN